MTIVGIDLGTTNSSIAIMEGGQPKIIPNAFGNRFTPSVVRFLENGEVVVGENALRARMVDPRHTITGVKRFIGRRYNEVFDIARRMPFEVTLGVNNLAVFRIRGIDYTPQLISAIILKALKESAETYLGEHISKAVIIVPAYFGEIQREATREAGEIASFDVKRIISEPEAAALAYGVDKKLGDSKIAVYDLGGGTFDISILDVANVDDERQFEVLSISGDGFLGGDDFDRKIFEWLIEEIRQEYGKDLSSDKLVLQRLLEAAIQAKHELSEKSQVNIRLPFLFKNNDQFINLDVMLSRAIFKELCEELFERLYKPCKNALKAGFLVNSVNDIDEILMVGGGTRIFNVCESAEEFFGRKPRTLINPQDAVALGAAIEAGVLEGKVKDVLLLDVIPHGLGVEVEGGITHFLIEANTTIPTKSTQIFSTSLDNQISVEVNIVEGNSSRVIDNRSLGRLILDGIPPAPRGVPQIEVRFFIDADKIIDILVKDKATGKESSLRVRSWTGLSREAIMHSIKSMPMIHFT